MGFYAEWILPPLIDLSMRNKRLRPYRERTAGAAEGRVLDVGIGSGLNLPFYARKAREIFGLDPSLTLLARAQRKAARTQTPVHLLKGSAECIPLADHGRAPESRIARWQDRLNPFWQRFSGGCHLNRKIDDLLSDAGFQIDRLATGYIAGPKIMTFFYEGAAMPR